MSPQGVTNADIVSTSESAVCLVTDDFDLRKLLSELIDRTVHRPIIDDDNFKGSVNLVLKRQDAVARNFIAVPVQDYYADVGGSEWHGLSYVDPILAVDSGQPGRYSPPEAANGSGRLGAR